MEFVKFQSLESSYEYGICIAIVIVWFYTLQCISLFLKDHDNDVISLEGSVSDNTSFKSGPADAFDA